MKPTYKMCFFRDSFVSSVLTKTSGTFLGSFTARRAKTRDGFCPILIHKYIVAPATRHIPVAVQNCSIQFCLRAGFLALTKKSPFSKAASGSVI